MLTHLPHFFPFPLDFKGQDNTFTAKILKDQRPKCQGFLRPTIFKPLKHEDKTIKAISILAKFSWILSKFSWFSQCFTDFSEAEFSAYLRLFLTEHVYGALWRYRSWSSSTSPLRSKLSYAFIYPVQESKNNLHLKEHFS